MDQNKTTKLNSKKQNNFTMNFIEAYLSPLFDNAKEHGWLIEIENEGYGKVKLYINGIKVNLDIKTNTWKIEKIEGIAITIVTYPDKFTRWWNHNLFDIKFGYRNARKEKTNEQFIFIAEKINKHNPQMSEKEVLFLANMYKNEDHDNFLWGKYGIQCDYEANQCFDDDVNGFVILGGNDEKLW